MSLTIARLASTRALRFIPVPTPRWPDLLCVYFTSDRMLFCSKMFAAHVAPELAGARAQDSAFDEGGWDVYGQDWKYYHDCMLAPVARQATGRACLRAHTLGFLGRGHSPM